MKVTSEDPSNVCLLLVLYPAIIKKIINQIPLSVLRSLFVKIVHVPIIIGQLVFSRALTPPDFLKLQKAIQISLNQTHIINS